MKHAVFLFVLLFILFSSCKGPGDPLEIECILPDMPDTWLSRSWTDGCRVVYRDSSGDPVEALFPSCAGFVKLLIPRRGTSPILVYPRGGIIPAGGVMPWDINNAGRLLLTWDHGWTALLLFRLSAAGSVMDALNIRRLFREVAAESGGNPWLLDMDYALRSLSYGRFNVYGLTGVPFHEVEIPADPGDWCSDNPFTQPVAVGHCGLLKTTLGEGYHRYRSLQHGVLDIDVSEDGLVWVNRLTGDAGSVTW